ncbi:MAG: hypothetical protein ACK5V3_00110, partial [Bdellovibrionales bacterium]
ALLTGAYTSGDRSSGAASGSAFSAKPLMPVSQVKAKDDFFQPTEKSTSIKSVKSFEEAS